MVEIKFKSKIRRWTNSFVAPVPVSYVDNNLLQEGKTYEFTAVEVFDDGNE